MKPLKPPRGMFKGTTLDQNFNKAPKEMGTKKEKQKEGGVCTPQSALLKKTKKSKQKSTYKWGHTFGVQKQGRGGNSQKKKKITSKVQRTSGGKFQKKKKKNE